MKIAVIGGAGVRTVIFINGLLARYKALHIDEVALYDINQEKQQIITKLCRHVVNRNHKDLIVTESADVRKVLQDADYVVTTLRVGGDGYWQIERWRDTRTEDEATWSDFKSLVR